MLSRSLCGTSTAAIRCRSLFQQTISRFGEWNLRSGGNFSSRSRAKARGLPPILAGSNRLFYDVGGTTCAFGFVSFTAGS